MNDKIMSSPASYKVKRTKPKSEGLKMIFVILALVAFFQIFWWGYILIELQRLGSIQDIFTQHSDLPPFLKSTTSTFQKMIFAEGAFFIAVWSFSMILIYRLTRKEQKYRQIQSDFTSAVTHELKTPLANIQLCLENILSTSTDPQNNLKSIQRFSERALISCTRLKKQIESILTMSQSGINLSAPQEIKLTHYLEKLLQNLRSDGILHNQGLRLDIHPNLVDKTVTLHVDETGFILTNLIENALVHATEPDAKTEKPLLLSVEQKNQKLIFQVQDHGPGIPEQDLKQITKPFIRLKRTTELAKGGTGLGLTIVQRLTHLQKGELFFKNLKPGFQVTVHIPLAKQKSLI